VAGMVRRSHPSVLVAWKRKVIFGMCTVSLFATMENSQNPQNLRTLSRTPHHVRQRSIEKIQRNSRPLKANLEEWHRCQQ